MKICIGVPCLDYIRSKTVATIVSIIKKYPSTELIIKQGSYIHRNREDIAEGAIKDNCDYLFYIDSDMCFSYQVLERLLSHNKDIVGANYNRRSAPVESLTLFRNPDGTYSTRELPSELFECDAIGTGCLLIKISAFNKIKKPWFFYGTETRMIGEDIFFCEKAKEAGLKIWCDPNIGVGHLGEAIY